MFRVQLFHWIIKSNEEILTVMYYWLSFHPPFVYIKIHLHVFLCKNAQMLCASVFLRGVAVKATTTSIPIFNIKYSKKATLEEKPSTRILCRNNKSYSKKKILLIPRMLNLY